MDNPKFIAQNLSLYTLTATATNPSYPLSNLKTYIAQEIWKSAYYGEQWVKVDFGEAVEINTCIIHKNNFSSIGSNAGEDAIKIEYSSDDINWSQSAYINFEDCADLIYSSFTAHTKRYWRIYFYGPTYPFLDYPYIGNLFFAKTFDIGRPYDFPYTLISREYNTDIGTSLSGIVRTAQLAGARQRIDISFAGTKGGLPDTVITNFQSFFAIVRGRYHPFYFRDTDGSIYYCHLDLDLDPSKKHRVNINDIKSLPMYTQLVLDN